MTIPRVEIMQAAFVRLVQGGPTNTYEKKEEPLYKPAK